MKRKHRNDDTAYRIGKQSVKLDNHVVLELIRLNNKCLHISVVKRMHMCRKLGRKSWGQIYM